MMFDQLLELMQKIDHEIATRQDQELDTLKSRMGNIASVLGVTLPALLGIKGVERRAKRAWTRIKYRDPDNPANTWNGKGRVPAWMQEKLDQGADKQAFVVT